MLITDQVATAPCTDPIQVRFPTFEAKLIQLVLPEVAFGVINSDGPEARLFGIQRRALNRRARNTVSTKVVDY